MKAMAGAGNATLQSGFEASVARFGERPALQVASQKLTA